MRHLAVRMLSSVFAAIFATAFSLTWAQQAAAQKLPPVLKQAAREAGLNLAETGIVVVPLNRGSARLSINAERAMNPASTMKLVTTAAALHLLGPAHTWRTEAHLDGTLHEGTLQGHLILKGGGDPKLTLEEFWLMLRNLRARGVRHIEGDVVLDRSLFAPASGQAGDFDGDGLRPYNALPDALLVNFNALRLDFIPRPATHGVEILMSPAVAPLRIDNRLQLGEGNCDTWPQNPTPQAEQGTLRFDGVFPLACGETTRNYSPLAGPAYTEALFRLLWRELGGTLSGRFREGAAPSASLPFLTQESEPLAEVIRDINKFSNNVMARQLFLALGSAGSAPPLDARKAFQAVEKWLSTTGLSFKELHMENGSGLSRHERISPAHLGALLAHMARSPFAPEFMASLPLSALDGTMRKRLADTPVAGRAHIKTGYLDGVRASAGYVLDENNNLVVVVCIVNGASADTSKVFHDALIAWAHSPRSRKSCCGR